jgi:hypothetical protein
MKNERSQCTVCGAWEAPGLYHPHAFCVLVAHYRGDVAAARLTLDSILDWGRKLERHGLPNSARIGTVFNADTPRKQKKATKK